MSCPWKNAVIDACVVACVGFYENDPKRTLENLIRWETTIALDPKVSKAAADLIQQGMEKTYHGGTTDPMG